MQNERIVTTLIENIYGNSGNELPAVVYVNNPLECLVALTVLNSSNFDRQLGNNWQNVVVKLHKHWDFINYAFDGDFSRNKKQVYNFCDDNGAKICPPKDDQNYIALEIYKDFNALFPIYKFQENRSDFHSYFHQSEDELPFLFFIPFQKICFVCNGPIVFETNEFNQLHGQNKPAVIFNDGYSFYFWKDIRIPAEWIYAPETINRSTIILCQNIAQRMALVEILGNEKFVALLDICIEEIDHYNGQEIVLLRTKSKDKFIDDYLFYIKVICNSTNREYYISIPREAFLLNAIGALAWTFGLEADEYQLLIET